MKKQVIRASPEEGLSGIVRLTFDKPEEKKSAESFCKEISSLAADENWGSYRFQVIGYSLGKDGFYHMNLGVKYIK